MAITIKDKSLFDQSPKLPPVKQVAKPPEPTISREVAIILSQQISELGRRVSMLADQPKPPVSVVATIQRDKDGRMESILITQNDRMN